MKKGDTFHVAVISDHYKAVLNASCVYSREKPLKGGKESGQLLAAVVSPVDERNRRQWLQIIHDRKHSLPREIDPWLTVYDEIYRNIRMRRERRKKKE